MRILQIIAVVLSTMLVPLSGRGKQADQPKDESKMQWFADAKLGIFIHWGIYAVDGVGESWSFHNRQLPYDDYMRQLAGFTASSYDPGEWAEAIGEAGARYAVLTSKHHDGVALWDTKMNDLSVPRRTPAGRDVIAPFVEALRARGIKVGLYFSLIDWSHPDYPGFLRDSSRYNAGAAPDRWRRFVQFYQGQLNELMTQFDPDLYWFDGDWEHSAEEWQAAGVRDLIRRHNPAAIINGRLQGFGDYDTPEQNLPIERPGSRCWELCQTMNDSWGYQGRDTNYKTPSEIITIFADVISMGGNLLLDIGPQADGTIPEKQRNILRELGRWTARHAEAIFGTVAGPPPGHFYGPATLSKDSLSLYLFLPGRTGGDVVVKGLNCGVAGVTVVGSGETVTYRTVGKISWSPVPGLIFIHPPENQDEYMTVLKVSLDSPLALYRGKGGLQ
ncbi:MAG TPA: alpha-L-fucosidase [candidate division Zixibacteria bacterium]|nr:alpha-L-fucosidase [candidate division Zixibacteria bacterium]MDD4916532.1 alpha-L-fucosidase [candidate division Zixibacteria bacterium]MDM7974230.1 alpha-L-fucosidase [candidate division Zixibacteria bacterium]HOD66102.1 alpha-L-fucosidase [candidate division Zixibacteria bacterium]HOZ09069.1 alpha-L-fucosidase [candidate division Zixibacteria bacterium]